MAKTRDPIERVLTGEALAEREAAKSDDDALRRLVRRGTRRDAAIVVAVLALAAFVLMALFQRGSESDRADRSSATALDLATQVQAACKAGGAIAKALGSACADSKEVTSSPEIQRGERGLQGRQGPAGPPGPQGAPGLPGTKGDPGANGKDGKNGTNGSDGAQGLPGTKGDPGADGKNGIDGRNGTDGKDGADGRPGADGRDGAAGQPPLRWAFTSADGTPYTCERSSDFSAEAPTYTCTSSAGVVPLRVKG